MGFLPLFPSLYVYILLRFHLGEKKIQLLQKSEKQ